ncbi:MAG: alpha/beta hydrolase [Panacibacter sp.]
MIIYKQYNQEQLNNQYNNRLHVPDFADYLERWDKRSIETRNRHAYISNIRYGDHSRECLDLFPSGKPNAKVLVFIHGGYWQMFDKTKFHFIADTFVPHGITTVLINYPLAPDATMDEMVASCRKALRWLHEHLNKYNADPQQVYLAGHSAGGHLAAMFMQKEWARGTQHFIKGVYAISGLYNLRPIQLSYLNKVLQMDEAMAIRNSPVELMPSTFCPLLIAVGEAETQEFKEQGHELFNKGKNNTVSIDLVELPGLNHFSILDSLVYENALLCKSLLKLIGI